MRLPKRGERGFTLIELLIVVAILGVLAAVVIPNVTRFVGSGKSEAAETELHNVQLAVTSMMLENGLTSITTTGYPDSGSVSTNVMTFEGTGPTTGTAGFPDYGTLATAKGGTFEAGDQDGYVLFGHDIIGDAMIPPAGAALVNYINNPQTTYFYTCDADGTVRQYADADKAPMPTG